MRPLPGRSIVAEYGSRFDADLGRARLAEAGLESVVMGDPAHHIAPHHMTDRVFQLVVMDEGHPIRIAVNPESREPRPYILVRDRLEALILRPVYYQLMELAVEQGEAEDGRIGVWSDGVFFDLGNSA